MNDAANARCRECPPMPLWRILLKWVVQTAVFWGFFLFIVPWAIAWLESRFDLLGFRFASPLMRGLGVALFTIGSALGLSSGVTMAVVGRGTPIPFDCPPRLVVAGPYRFIRNPMVVAGIAQGIAAGLYLGSWPIIIYALCGAIGWNMIVRPWEERDLVARFGGSYQAYRRNIRCWIPRLHPHPGGDAAATDKMNADR